MGDDKIEAWEEHAESLLKRVNTGDIKGIRETASEYKDNICTPIYKKLKKFRRKTTRDKSGRIAITNLHNQVEELLFAATEMELHPDDLGKWNESLRTALKRVSELDSELEMQEMAKLGIDQIFTKSTEDSILDARIFGNSKNRSEDIKSILAKRHIMSQFSPGIDDSTAIKAGFTFYVVETYAVMANQSVLIMNTAPVEREDESTVVQEPLSHAQGFVDEENANRLKRGLDPLALVENMYSQSGITYAWLMPAKMLPLMFENRVLNAWCCVSSP